MLEKPVPYIERIPFELPALFAAEIGNACSVVCILYASKIRPAGRRITGEVSGRGNADECRPLHRTGKEAGQIFLLLGSESGEIWSRGSCHRHTHWSGSKTSSTRVIRGVTSMQTPVKGSTRSSAF